MNDVVLAIDGGNVKTDVALLAADGGLLSLIRGGTSSPHLLGYDGSVATLSQLISDACAAADAGAQAAGLASGQRAGGERTPTEPVAEIAHVLLAGADLPEEVELLERGLGAVGWARQLVVENDTLALLRTGTSAGWGVAVVCGGGINAVGIGPDGAVVRFPALTAITGDWGGGHDVGVAALGAANRSADGRGPLTTLEQAVPLYFGMETPLDVARAVHFKELSLGELAELSRVVYAQAEVDQVSRGILERQADEVSALACTALRRLDICELPADVVLGGGMIRAAPRWMLERIESAVHSVAPAAEVLVTHEGPIVGAALLGLDAVGAGPEAIARARAGLQEAVEALGSQPPGRAAVAGPARAAAHEQL